MGKFKDYVNNLLKGIPGERGVRRFFNKKTPSTLSLFSNDSPISQNNQKNSLNLEIPNISSIVEVEENNADNNNKTISPNLILFEIIEELKSEKRIYVTSLCIHELVSKGINFKKPWYLDLVEISKQASNSKNLYQIIKENLFNNFLLDYMMKRKFPSEDSKKDEVNKLMNIFFYLINTFYKEFKDKKNEEIEIRISNFFINFQELAKKNSIISENLIVFLDEIVKNIDCTKDVLKDENFFKELFSVIDRETNSSSDTEIKSRYYHNSLYIKNLIDFYFEIIEKHYSYFNCIIDNNIFSYTIALDDKFKKYDLEKDLLYSRIEILKLIFDQMYLSLEKLPNNKLTAKTLEIIIEDLMLEIENKNFYVTYVYSKFYGSESRYSLSDLISEIKSYICHYFSNINTKLEEADQNNKFSQELQIQNYLHALQECPLNQDIKKELTRDFKKSIKFKGALYEYLSLLNQSIFNDKEFYKNFFNNFCIIINEKTEYSEIYQFIEKFSLMRVEFYKKVQNKNVNIFNAIGKNFFEYSRKVFRRCNSSPIHNCKDLLDFIFYKLLNISENQKEILDNTKLYEMIGVDLFAKLSGISDNKTTLDDIKDYINHYFQNIESNLKEYEQRNVQTNNEVSSVEKLSINNLYIKDDSPELIRN